MKWNVLQLPEKVVFKNGHRIEYTYDALGVKRQVRYVTAAEPVSMVMGNSVSSSTPRTESVEVVDYCGETIYENGKKTILTENGYIGAGSHGSRTYHIYLSDYQGNIRGVLNEDGDLLQVNHYYPSGLSFAEDKGTTVQSRKYNGKKLDRTHGVNIYDYGWRMYDPAIVEWWGVDKLAEKYYSTSSYAYCLGNPVNYVDPDGREIKIGSWLGRFLATLGFKNFESKVQTQINQLKKDDNDVKTMIETMEQSEKIIEIFPTNNLKGTDKNSTRKKYRNAKIKQGSTIYYDINENATSLGARDSRVALAHELGHADDLINGRGLNKVKYREGETTKKEIDVIQKTEDHPIEMENKIRKKIGIPLRPLDYFYNLKK